MILLGIKVMKNVVDGKEFTRKRAYFARSIKDSDGSIGLMPVYSADFNKGIDTSNLVSGCDYVVETYDYTRTNKDTGEVYTFKMISDIVTK